MKRLETLEKERIMCEAQRCLLCYDPPCDKACPNKCSPAEFVRSLYFENEAGAKQQMHKIKNALKLAEACENKYCEKACVRGKLDKPIEIRAIHKFLAKNEKEAVK